MHGRGAAHARRVAPVCVALALAGVAAQAVFAGPTPDPVIDSVNEGSSNGLAYRSATFPAVGPSGSEYAVAKCPKGEVLTGGGGSTTGAALEARFLELGPNKVPDIPTKARKSFTAQGQNMSSNPLDFESLAICARKKGLSMETATTPEPDSNAVVSAKAKCPKGTSVTGGGLSSDSNLEYILISAPYDGGDADSNPDDGWEASLVTGVGQPDRELRALAFCSANFKLAYRSDSDADVTDVGHAEADCPEKAAITGGGISISGGDGAFLNASHPLDGTDAGQAPDDSWEGNAGVTSGNRTVDVYAICRK
jgi:hypothetical protein